MNSDPLNRAFDSAESNSKPPRSSLSWPEVVFFLGVLAMICGTVVIVVWLVAG